MKGRAGTIGKFILFVHQFSCVFMDSFAKLFLSIFFQKSSINTRGGS
jgi:hypothetical protein